ncbi:MAG: hypothetical protein ACFB4I_14650 [Cyanophyceae cyanobacterium]
MAPINYKPLEQVDPPQGTESATSGDGPNGSVHAKPPAKLEVYERYLRIPYYLVYSRTPQQLRYFKFDGGQYQEQPLNSENPLAWFADLKIGLGIWSGEFAGVSGDWLRWCDHAGNWRLTD